VLALSYYRTGQCQKAGELLTEFLKARPDGPCEVANWLVMALTEQRLGHAEKAQAWFSKADLWVKEEIAKRMGQPENPYTAERFPWLDWLIIQLLHREAGALIRGKTADEPPQQKTTKPNTKAQKS
jgi:hypothetical protein